ncbi:unnamed protein product [Caenorhabditis auriculariae]|uniref:Potassium channel domain-containing protein n=1 Tax=Caenorhabditis auriculariae TaxID=2777116 RepID=A0A8S1H7C5_9PELO|nr:unnamed protein product [Caenorhabditis auriculariae]
MAGVNRSRNRDAPSHSKCGQGSPEMAKLVGSGRTTAHTMRPVGHTPTVRRETSSFSNGMSASAMYRLHEADHVAIVHSPDATVTTTSWISLLGLTPSSRRGARRLSKFLAGMVLLALLLAQNFVAAAIFWLAEANSIPKDTFSHQDCLKLAHDQIKLDPRVSNKFEADNLINRTLSLVDKCLKESTRIDSLPKGFMFAWSVYTTIGYGNFYPHSMVGQLLATIYALLTIPLYVAVKAELGYFLSISTLHLANGIKLICQFIRKRMRKKSSFTVTRYSNPKARDYAIFVTCCVVCSIMVIIFTVVFSLTEDQPLLTSLYFTVISVLLVGLGDVTPSHLNPFLIIYCPIFIVADILSSHILYYIHGRLRLSAHLLTRKILRMPYGVSKRNNEISVDSEEADVPHVTTTCMPMNVLSCERVEKQFDEALLQPAYHPSSGANSEDECDSNSS